MNNDCFFSKNLKSIIIFNIKYYEKITWYIFEKSEKRLIKTNENSKKLIG